MKETLKSRLPAICFQSAAVQREHGLSLGRHRKLCGRTGERSLSSQIKETVGERFVSEKDVEKNLKHARPSHRLLYHCRWVLSHWFDPERLVVVSERTDGFCRVVEV